MFARVLLLAALSIFIAAPTAPVHQVCSGFLPENDMSIPVSFFNTGGVTESEFNSVLDLIQSYYTPVVASLGGRLVVNRDWQSTVVNASANQSGNTYTINMYGGLARHQVMTADGFMLVACHEMGHHLGGAPKINNWFSDWASNEGAADYYATVRCLRFIMKDEENTKFVKDNNIDMVLRTKCEQIYNTQEEENFCMRMGSAGFAAASLFHSMRKLETPLRFDTPDMNIVSSTYDDHPEPQCRLDTYFQGSLCVTDITQPLSDSNPNQGTCSVANGQSEGVRPLCWFKP